MEQSQLQIGVRLEETEDVTEERTAERVGSGSLPVWATPEMIRLMEKTAAKSVQPYLPEGSSTVGTSLEIRHIAATPVGMKVRCDSLLTGMDRRKLTFTLQVYDEKELVGEGTHERFIVENRRFLDKALAKKG